MQFVIILSGKIETLEKEVKQLKNSMDTLTENR